MKSLQYLENKRLQRWPGRGYRGGIVLCLLALFLVACDNGQNTSHRQTIQTNTGSTITYSTQPQDVLIRLFYGGGKVGDLELTPEISIYGDGTFITGAGLQLQKGSLSSDAIQNLLQMLTSTDKLQQMHRQIFDDLPDQNVTLLQVALNGQNYQFIYGPFGNLAESSQDMQEYRQLGNAISAIKSALIGPESTYTSQKMALLVYQTFRADFTAAQNLAIPQWPLTDLSLANTAIYECGAIPQDQTGPNADNGCLTYTAPLVAYLPSNQDLQGIEQALQGKQQGMFLEDGNYYVVMLRPLLPDEIAQNKLAMYGSNTQTYAPVPLKGGAVPVPTATP